MNGIRATSRKASEGVSLVELMVGMLAAAILAITAGAMLYYGYTAWYRNTALVALQRDSTTAMRAIERALRGATNAVFAGGQLVAFQLDGSTRTFALDAAGRLALNGSPITEAGVLSPTGFACTVVGDGVAVRLALSGAEGNIENYEVFHLRN